MMHQAINDLGPVIRIGNSDCEPSLFVMYRKGSAHSMISGVTLLYHSFGLHSERKFIETFSNGLVVQILYLTHNDASHPVCEQVRGMAQEAALLYALPRTSLTHLVKQRVFTKSEECYAYSWWKLVYHFLSSFATPDISAISASLDTKSRGMLAKISEGFRRDALTEPRVLQAIEENVEIVKKLYVDFEHRFAPTKVNDASNTAESAAARQEALRNTIRRSAASEFDSRILLAMLELNSLVLRTNFYKCTKVALSFRLNPSFLSSQAYAVRPFAIFFIVGAEFRGFHVRFVDIARGGIRIIQSRNAAAFAINVSNVFDENYNLALTQQSKNKDIPEGGSKGTVLLSAEHQDKGFVAFRKYVDSLLDLLLASDEIVDRYKQTELLFLGPDEGTADMMGWACLHAQSRGYGFWKSFTTGKPPSLGGIPHDTYGMTTRSVHSYVLGILAKLGIDEHKIKKLQTGGPDGDLGSNEIKISSDNTVGVVDGSGVLYDPNGIDRQELLRLATARIPCANFDRTKLSPGGFLVLVDDVDVVLPNGRKIDSGLLFRNSFHLERDLLADVDLFVPCGGRPAAINATNVHLLWDETRAAPLFKYIVEGANLFLTQDARLKLEEDYGVVVYKDSACNKGGVQSSSLEVLAALALSSEQYEQHMCVHDEQNVPPFYSEYVRDVQAMIQDRATLEFEALWREREHSKRPICILTDELSSKINQLAQRISDSSLWNSHSLRAAIITRAIPPSLVKLVGIEAVLQRVPESYLKAIFGSYIACQFVYQRGVEPNSEIDFYEFLSAIQQQQQQQ
jgi:glutamate dehydrogenase